MPKITKSKEKSVKVVVREPVWLTNARAELGTTESPGVANNPKVLKFWEDAKLSFIKDDSTPWCAGFVNAILERSGVRGTRRANARSFLNWGVAHTEPRLGSIAILSRPPNPWQGHVGFVVSHDVDTVTLLGGNQGDKVSYARFKKSRVLGYRWPDSTLPAEELKPTVAVAKESESER